MKKLFLGIPKDHSLDAFYPPVGILYIAAAVCESGHVVKVVDGQVVGDEELLREFTKDEFDYFGTTILTPLREASYDLIRKIKALRPQCITIAGGAHVSILPEQTLRHIPELDIIVIGEGEQTLAEILSGKALDEIAGICFRKGEEPKRTPRRKPLDPAILPMPAWDLIDIYLYHAFEEIEVEGVDYSQKPFLTIYTSRGCTGSCSFCSTWWNWGKWRQIPAIKVIREIEYLYKRGVDHFFIADDSMIEDEGYVEMLADELQRRNINIKFKIACRADKVTQRISSALKRAGCYEAHIGFESGSQRILDSLNKRLKVEDNIRATKLLKEAGIKVYGLLIIGSIQEDISSINETIDFLNLIQPDVIASMGHLMLLPGTLDFRTAARQGVVNNDFWLGKEKYPIYTKNFSRSELSFLAWAVRKRIKVWPGRLFRLQFQLLNFYQSLRIKLQASKFYQSCTKKGL